MCYIKSTLTFLFIILVCCVSFQSEAAVKHSERIYWHIEQTITVKNNKALCSLQGAQRQHIKYVIAEYIKNDNIKFVVQSDIIDQIVFVECR